MFMVAINAAILPKMKADTIAPVMIISELTKVYVSFLGAISFPTMVKIA